MEKEEKKEISITNKVLPLLLLSIVILGMFLIVPKFGTDFALLYPAGEAVLKGQNPYIYAPKFFNPPWMLLFLTPMATMKIEEARYVWMFIGIVLYI